MLKREGQHFDVNKTDPSGNTALAYRFALQLQVTHSKTKSFEKFILKGVSFIILMYKMPQRFQAMWNMAPGCSLIKGCVIDKIFKAVATDTPVDLEI